MADAIVVLRVESKSTGDIYEVSANYGDIYTWEKTNKRGRSLPDLSKPSAQDMYEVAHVAVRRAGRFDGPLAEFTDAFIVEPAGDGDEDSDDEGEADPTPPGL